MPADAPSDIADALTPTRLVAYVSGGGPNIVAFEVDRGTGAMTQIGSTPTFGPSSSFLAIAADGAHLYAVSESTNRVGAYAIDRATAALAFLREQRPQHVSDDPRADLIEELRRFRSGIERPNGMAMLGTVLAEESHVPELLAHFRDDVVLPRRARLRGILERARLRQGIDVEAAINVLVGSYYGAYLAGGKPRRGWERRVAEAVLEPRTPASG